MLQSLHVKHFAIIDELEVEFGPGLTILSGETGAGKSILIDALGLVLGDRADKSVVTQSAKQAEITAVFSTAGLSDVGDWLDEQAIEVDDELIIRRVIGRDGRSKALVNGVTVALQNLRQLGDGLIEIHGQHAHQLLTRAVTQRDLLDRFARAQSDTDKVAGQFANWEAASAAYEQFRQQAADRDNRLEFLRFQKDELDKYADALVHYEKLESERDRLRHADQLKLAADTAAGAVYDNENANAQSLVASAAQALSAVREFAPEIGEVEQLLGEAEASLQEAGLSLQRFAGELSADPARQLELDDTLAAIRELGRKHRCDAAELGPLAAKFESEIHQLESVDVELATLKEAADEALAQYLKAGRALSKKREKAAAKLQKSVSDAMQELGMRGGVFEVNVATDEDRITATGMDNVHFLVSANPGRAPQPLAKVASGGELSRISLAVQVITADVTATPSMVFDEVDAGIGGGVAEIVGARLREIGAERQVLCVTHLPQVASQGHHHFQISKITDGKSTHTGVRELSMKARIDEVARMLGGVEITAKSRAHAKEMLDSASKISRSA